MPKNGYLYVYVSNESKGNVYFDDIRIEHTKGSLIEETHYYPFGLTMSGISSMALKSQYAENKKRYNANELQSKEFSDGSGLEEYDFNARTYDQQLGRFIQIDPLFEKEQESLTPYHFSNNNPIRYNDPTGKCPPCLLPFLPAIAEGLITAAAVVGTYMVIVSNKENIRNIVNSPGLRFQDDQLKSIEIDDNNKIPRDQLDPPSKPGNDPTFKKDGTPVEMHHEGQNPDGPFREMHQDDHRRNGNDKINHPDKSKPSKIDRKQFLREKREYWRNQFPEIT